MSELAVSTHGLTKRYGNGVLAVADVSVSVARGEIYAFLGLNGAGKSTTIRMLLGMIAPTAGTVEVLGQRIVPGITEVWRQVGHLVESASAYPELTVRENLRVAARLRGARDPDVIERLIDRLALTEYVDRRASDLSLGNLQRLALATALVNEPKLVILDEPANGLDPAGVIEVRELLASIARDSGVTVFMSSHVLGEVDRLATRLGIVHRGRLVEELDAATLLRHRDPRLEVRARDPDTAERVLREAGRDPERQVSSAGDVVLELRDELSITEPDRIASLLVNAGCPPLHLAQARETLEEHFVRLTTGTDGP